MTTWTVGREKVLTRSEIQAVLADLHRKARRSINTRMNLVLFRLATCCGLRASELSSKTVGEGANKRFVGGLRLRDVRVSSTSPSIRIPKALGKGGKARVVPLNFDQGTLDDLRAWKQDRIAAGATEDDFFLCTQSKRGKGKPIDRHNARKRFKACCRVLGKERQAEVTIHHGRHSFISHALHAGRSVVEVKEAAGHSSLATTSIYSHLVGDDDGAIGNIFG